MKNRLSGALIVAIALASAASSATKSLPLRIIASAETHAMLYPCDCPKDPGGGLATRASVIADQRRGHSVLLVDAGGFAGGGIYDSYSEGRSRDSVRTLAAVKALGMIGYDAVTLGDEELQYGEGMLIRAAARSNLPLVSANCRTTDGRALVPEFIVVARNGIRFGITGVTTQERLFPVDSGVVVEPPLNALRRIWPALRAASDVRIILAHTGEEESVSLLAAFPDCNVVVNGHRKKSAEPVIVKSGRALMQFGFLGKSLAFADVALDKDHLIVQDKGWIDVGPWVKEDSLVGAAIRTIDKSGTGPVSPVWDLYIMSQCPYGLPALKEMLEFSSRFTDATWNLCFIGTEAADSTLSSLHGESEVFDEMLWLGVRALYPQRWVEFLTIRADGEGRKSRDIAASLGLDEKAIDAWIAARGRGELALHYRRSMRLGINASPTLTVNNVPVEIDIRSPRLARLYCSSAHAPMTACDSLPACFEDADCRAPGKLGSCRVDSLGKNRCEYRDDAAFTFTIVRAESTLTHPEDRFIRTTIDLFPAVRIDTVAASSARGRKLVQDAQPAILPLYLFDTTVQQAVNFARIQPGLVRVHDKLTFKDDVVAGNFLWRRPAESGSIVVYVDPAFADAPRVVGMVLALVRKGKPVRILPTMGDDSSDVAATYRREESERWLVLTARFPRNYPRYLRWYAAHPGSSYWMEGLREAGVRVKTFTRLRAAAGDLLNQHVRLMEEMRIQEPVTLLIDNREIAPVKNRAELRRFLGVAQ